MSYLTCLNCGKDLTDYQRMRKNTFCCKGCATSFRQKASDLNPFKEENELKYYLLGLIFADGNLSKSQNSYRLSIRLNDLDLISLLYPLFSDTSKRIIYKEEFLVKNKLKPSYLIINSNLEAIDICRYFGITERKSLTMLFPSIPDIFLKDFIRGYFDGDGSVFISSKYKDTVYLGVTFTSGSKKFLEVLQKILLKHSISSSLLTDYRGHSYILRIYKQEEIKIFRNFIYDSSNYYLTRKKDIFYQ